jgi:hypothetical protein
VTDSKPSTKLTVACPACGSDLTVDAATGEVLFHKKPKAPPAGGHDFDSLMKGLDSERERAEAVFERSKSALKDQDRLLEEKFEEALRRAKEDPDDEPPPRPWDLD